MPIACVHIPRFAVEIERQRRADIAARLILIGEPTVIDCSLGAEASGVRRGMRMSEAVGLCHRAVVLPPDLPHYQRRMGEVLDFLEEYSPAVESGDLGNAYLSLGGLPVDLTSYAEQLVSALHRRHALMPSVGIAGGKFPARLAAQVTRAGSIKMISSGEEAAFLTPLPVEQLPAGDSMLWRLHLLGIETIGEVACLPLGAFQQQFGLEGKRCWELANGVDNEPLVPLLKEETVVRRLELPSPTASLEAICIGVERLINAAYGDSGRSGRWVRKVVIRANLDGGGSWELPVAFREALANPRDAWFSMKTAIARRPPDRSVEELEVELTGLSAESGRQASMFESKGKLWQQIEETLRQLQTHQGRALIGKVVEVEPWSRIPERRAALADFDL